MIDRQKGCIVIECDSCDAVHEGSPDEDFTEVWANAKRDGWRTKKIGADWVHACPRCRV